MFSCPSGSPPSPVCTSLKNKFYTSASSALISKTKIKKAQLCLDKCEVLPCTNTVFMKKNINFLY